MRKHIIIAGTGRAGTTFLVQLLGHLGFDIGTGRDNLKFSYNKDTRCGFECNVLKSNAPYVCKDPRFSDYADEVFRRKDIRIEQILIPCRDLHNAAASRLYIHKTFGDVAGGMDDILYKTNSCNLVSQKKILLEKIYDLMLSTSRHHVPITLINYPLMINDARYLNIKLRSILDNNINAKQFDEAFANVSRSELVHNYMDI